MFTLMSSVRWKKMSNEYRQRVARAFCTFKAAKDFAGMDWEEIPEHIRRKILTVKTIDRSKLVTLSFTNSKNIPGIVNDAGTLREYVGIGWIDINQPITVKYPVIIG